MKTPNSIQIKSKSNPNQIFSFLALLSSSVSRANLNCVIATIFSSFALLSSSVSTANLSCLLATTFSNLSFLSNSFSSPLFNLLRVARCCFYGLLFLMTFSFPLVVFLVLLLTLSFSRLILSLSFLCSSLFTFSFSFLSEYLLLLFVHAIEALAAYSRNE